MSEALVKVGMPKWGLSMKQGHILDWLVEEGAEVSSGTEIVEIETEKIAGAIEAPSAGILRRRVAARGEDVPVGGLVAVIADAATPDEEIDSFVAEFQAHFVPPQDDEQAGADTEKVEIGEVTIRYQMLSEGEPALVLLHGFGADLNNWLFNSQALSENRRVYALDFPGHGGSTKKVEGFKELVDVFAEFLDQLGITRAHLAGHSMGGAVAFQYALDNPDRVTSLVLIDSAALGDDINAGYINGFIAANKRRELKEVLKLLFADEDLVTRQMVDDVLKYKRVDGVQTALRALADDMFTDGRQNVVLAPRLAEVKVPVLVIWGAQDRILPAAQAQALPGSVRVEVLKGQGHSPHMEGANEVNRLIEGFLDEEGV